jgi:hypothetical protein
MVTEVGLRMRSLSGHYDRSPNGSFRRLQALTWHRAEQYKASCPVSRDVLAISRDLVGFTARLR